MRMQVKCVDVSLIMANNFGMCFGYVESTVNSDARKRTLQDDSTPRKVVRVEDKDDSKK